MGSAHPLTRLPKAEKSDKAVPVVVQVVRVSGTIRKAEEEAVRRARRMMARARQEEKGIKGVEPCWTTFLGAMKGRKGKICIKALRAKGMMERATDGNTTLQEP